MNAFTIIILALGLIAMVVAGLRVRPRPIAPSASGPDAGLVELPGDLPAPVRRYHRELGLDRSHVPAVDTFALWGRAWMRRAPLPRLPVRFWSEHRVGWSARQRLAVTWYGIPVLRGVDDYIAGRGRMRIARQDVAGPEIDQGENLFLWAEMLLVPAVLAARPEARWEPIDSDSARLRVPLGDRSDELVVRFDPDTGLVTECRAMRYRAPGGPKVGWHIWYEQWTHFPAGCYPARISVRWADQRRPWFVLDVDGVAVNIPVDVDLRVGGPGPDTTDGPTRSTLTRTGL
jgi:hypothetical protein